MNKHIVKAWRNNNPAKARALAKNLCLNDTDNLDAMEQSIFEWSETNQEATKKLLPFPLRQETKEWALANKDEAKTLFMRLYLYKDNPEKLAELDSLGKMEDAIQAWAIKHKVQATLFVTTLLPFFK